MWKKVAWKCLKKKEEKKEEEEDEEEEEEEEDCISHGVFASFFWDRLFFTLSKLTLTNDEVFQQN